MSVITELFENYDHIPLEFRRQLLMMRELDDLSNSKYAFTNNFRAHQRERTLEERTYEEACG
jgi:hypothetical protein